MTSIVEIRKSYKYRLYRCDKKDKKLRHKLFVASTLWNHFIAVQRRYYRLSGKYIPLSQMNQHVLKLRKTQRFSGWRDFHSQACQDVCRRVDDADPPSRRRKSINPSRSPSRAIGQKETLSSAIVWEVVVDLQRGGDTHRWRNQHG